MNRGSGFGSASQASLAQMAADLNNLGLDPNTLKKLSMSGIRDFIPQPPTSSSSARRSSGGGDNSGSSSPYGGQSQPSFPPQRLQPPGGQPPYGSSPRASPTPSSVASDLASNAGPSGDPSSISTYSDGGTTYFYASDDMVSRRLKISALQTFFSNVFCTCYQCCSRYLAHVRREM